MSNIIYIKGNTNSTQIVVGDGNTIVTKEEKNDSVKLKNIEKQIDELNSMLSKYSSYVNNVNELREATSTVKAEIKKEKPDKEKINRNLDKLIKGASSVTVIAKAISALIEAIRMI